MTHNLLRCGAGRVPVSDEPFLSQALQTQGRSLFRVIPDKYEETSPFCSQTPLMSPDTFSPDSSDMRPFTPTPLSRPDSSSNVLRKLPHRSEKPSATWSATCHVDRKFLLRGGTPRGTRSRALGPAGGSVTEPAVLRSIQTQKLGAQIDRSKGLHVHSLFIPVLRSVDLAFRSWILENRCRYYTSLGQMNFFYGCGW